MYGTPELQLLFNIFTNPEGEKFNFYGDAVPVRTIKHDGSGTLFTAGSSAEVVGFNPDIETRAFKFSGEPIVRIRVILFGGGSMFGFGSGAESTTIPVPESTVLFVPSGAAVPVITLNYDGSGTELLVVRNRKRTASHVGDGSLFGTGGAAEAVAVSEAESTALFVPSGGDQNSFTRTKQGSGSAVINGNAVPVITLNFSGSGSLFSLGGSSEVTTVSKNLQDSLNSMVLPNQLSELADLLVLVHSSIGGGEEVAAVAEESTGLFTISGDAEAPFTRTKVGSGTTFVSGVKEESFSKGNYDGEGSFSTFGGAAEIVGFDPAEETFLYEFTGNATATRTRDLLDLELQLFSMKLLFQLSPSTILVMVLSLRLVVLLNPEQLMLKILRYLNSAMVQQSPSRRAIMMLMAKQQFLVQQNLSSVHSEIKRSHMSVFLEIWKNLTPEITSDLVHSLHSVVWQSHSLLQNHWILLYSVSLERTQEASPELRNQQQQNSESVESQIIKLFSSAHQELTAL